MSDKLSVILGNYKDAVIKIFEGKAVRLVLYGSYARGDFRQDSDVDVMVLVDLPDTQIESYSDALSELGFEYNIKYDIWFMPVVKNELHFGEWSADYPFYSNIVKEGITLYESI